MRRRIWEIGCIGIDAVLASSFDSDELPAIDAAFHSARVSPAAPGLTLPQDLLAFGIAHHLCHDENPYSCKIEKRLDAMHAVAVRAMERIAPEQVLASCYGAVEENREDIPGLIWAILTDPRLALRRWDAYWVHALVHRSLRHWLDRRRVGAEP